MRWKKMLATVVAGLAVAASVTACSSDDEPAPAEHAAEQQEPQWDREAAPDARWQSLAGIQVPTAKQGPHETDPVRYGYDASPQGAVLAAINGQAQLATADDQTWPKVSRLTLAAGEGRDHWAQARSLVSVSGSLPAEQAPTFEGFTVTDFSDTSAVVVLAVDYPGAGLVAYPVQLERLADDWKLVLPGQHNEVSEEPIDTLDGFIPFSAEGEEANGRR